MVRLKSFHGLTYTAIAKRLNVERHLVVDLKESKHSKGVKALTGKVKEVFAEELESIKDIASTVLSSEEITALQKQADSLKDELYHKNEEIIALQKKVIDLQDKLNSIYQNK